MGISVTGLRVSSEVGCQRRERKQRLDDQLEYTRPTGEGEGQLDFPHDKSTESQTLIIYINKTVRSNLQRMIRCGLMWF